jgi:NAD(P)H-flavin reductase
MGIYTIESIRQLTYDTYEMTLSGDMSWIKAPGQFVNIKIDGFFLRSRTRHQGAFHDESFFAAGYIMRFG